MQSLTTDGWKKTVVKGDINNYADFERLMIEATKDIKEQWKKGSAA